MLNRVRNGSCCRASSRSWPILIGALLLAGEMADGYPQVARIMATVAVVFATINVVGGFLVTHRMLAMFQKKK